MRSRMNSYRHARGLARDNSPDLPLRSGWINGGARRKTRELEAKPKH